MLNKHIFTAQGVHITSHPENAKVVFDSDGVLADKTNKVFYNRVNYPWPIKLEEGVIVQDTDKQPFECEWRKSSEVKKLKAARAKATKS